MCSNFSFQVDESTDITNMAQPLVFIRYDFHNLLNEKYLFCKPLESNTNPKNIFEIIDNYFSTIGFVLGKMCWHLYRRSPSYVWKIGRPSIESAESCAILQKHPLCDT